MTKKAITRFKEKSKLKKIGQKFGQWTILEKAENISKIKKQSYYRCQCDCGTIKNIFGGSLGKTSKSCGCLRIVSITKHGMNKTPEHQAWSGMRQRCTNPNSPHYHRYGGRGITVVQEWMDSFEAFYRDMGKKPTGLTLERINNELGYFKDNCCWASRKKQARNRKRFKTGGSGIVGISWYRRTQKYRVYIMTDNQEHHIGYFDTLDQAAIARKQAEQIYWRQT